MNVETRETDMPLKQNIQCWIIDLSKKQKVHAPGGLHMSSSYMYQHRSFEKRHA